MFSVLFYHYLFLPFTFFIPSCYWWTFLHSWGCFGYSIFRYLYYVFCSATIYLLYWFLIFYFGCYYDFSLEICLSCFLYVPSLLLFGFSVFPFYPLEWPESDHYLWDRIPCFKFLELLICWQVLRQLLVNSHRMLCSIFLFFKHKRLTLSVQTPSLLCLFLVWRYIEPIVFFPFSVK